MGEKRQQSDRFPALTLPLVDGGTIRLPLECPMQSTVQKIAATPGVPPVAVAPGHYGPSLRHEISLQDAANGHLRHRIPPIADTGIEIANAMHASMNMHVSLCTASRLPAAAWATTLGKIWPRNRGTELVIHFAAGIIGGKKRVSARHCHLAPAHHSGQKSRHWLELTWRQH
jgi:hypothetical protein